jgi:hypothetical protein
MFTFNSSYIKDHTRATRLDCRKSLSTLILYQIHPNITDHHVYNDYNWRLHVNDITYST